MLISRDSVVWWLGMVAAVITAIVANIDQFDWFSEDARKWLTLVSLIIGVISGKMATSPLPGERAVTMATATAKIADATDQIAKAQRETPDDTGRA